MERFHYAFSTKEEFLAWCREQVEVGECNLSAGDLELLLKIIDEKKED